MADNSLDKYQQIEQQLSDAFNTVTAVPKSENRQDKPVADEAAYDESYDELSTSDLLEIALNKADDEIYQLQGQLRKLREQHRRMEERLEKRLIQQESLKRKILEKITASQQNLSALG